MKVMLRIELSKIIVAYTVLLSCCSIYSQEVSGFNAVVIDAINSDPIIYANVFNYRSGKGTLTNELGYFEMDDIELTDSIVISFVGYRSFTLNLIEDKSIYNIELEPSSTELGEILIVPEDDGYLFDLINECRKNRSNNRIKAKAYYSLKTYEDTTQIELVEAYYNINANGYDLNSMGLKAGRLALRPHSDRIFTSMESSKAFSLMDLNNRNNYFPSHPFNVKKSKLKKSFYLYLKSKYLNEENDSIYVIDYEAKPSKNYLFSGTVWINKDKKLVEKIKYSCNSCDRFPFSPLFKTDRILNVDLSVTRSFKIENDKALFKHVDFNYSVKYESRPETGHSYTYNINSKAILYAYDYKEYFDLPKFKFNYLSTGDFRKINAMPYNQFFWNYNTEYDLNDAKDLNDQFFESELSIKNDKIFESNPLIKLGMFQSPYVSWSRKRVFLRDIGLKKEDENKSILLERKDLELVVKVFLDMDEYHGKFNILTATIFDPYESYFKGEANDRIDCFINIYFDLCEIMRRKLHLEIRNADNDRIRINSIYKTFLLEFDKQKKNYFAEVNRGKNEAEMYKWNDYVLEHLGINNIELFDPYKELSNKLEKPSDN